MSSIMNLNGIFEMTPLVELRWVWRNEPKEKVLQYRYRIAESENYVTHWKDVPIITEQAENEIGNA
jgi:hypothetical protein